MPRILCPACNTPTLTEYTIDEHELERCNTCHGLWFDEPQLMSFIEANANDTSKGFNLITDENFKGKGKRHCHSCDQSMMRHQLIETHDIEIDACHFCGTFWIEHEEIKHVRHSKDLTAALAEIHKGFNWKSWFFELLFRMPVEYNLKPHKTPWLTYSFILFNVVLFSIRFLSPEAGQWTIENLSLITPIESYPQFFISMFSSQFMHGDIMHILGNMYFLWVMGDNIEDALGKRLYGLAYIVCGTIGMLLEVGLALSNEQPMLLLGASAAVSGLFGMYLIWFRHAKLSIMIIFYQFRLPAVWFFSIWLITNIFGFISPGGGVAFLAHLGGFASGLLFALLYKKTVYANNPLIYLLNTQIKKSR